MSGMSIKQIDELDVKANDDQVWLPIRLCGVPSTSSCQSSVTGGLMNSGRGPSRIYPVYPMLVTPQALQLQSHFVKATTCLYTFTKQPLKALFNIPCHSYGPLISIKHYFNSIQPDPFFTSMEFTWAEQVPSLWKTNLGITSLSVWPWLMVFKLLKSAVDMIKPEHQPQLDNNETAYIVTSFKTNRVLWSCKSVLKLEIIPEDDPNWWEKLSVEKNSTVSSCHQARTFILDDSAKPQNICNNDVSLSLCSVPLFFLFLIFIIPAHGIYVMVKGTARLWLWQKKLWLRYE